jgi:RHS repeat-associated protein
LNVSASPVTASLSGTTINLQAKGVGVSTNYVINGSSSTSQPSYFTQPSFAVSSTTLSGGQGPAGSLAGNLTWNANGTLRTLAITDDFNSGGQTCNYGTSSTPGYDELGRLVNVNCTNSSGATVWSQTFSYDQFDNITKSGSISWMPGYNLGNNHYTLAGTSYDNNGNLTNDSFHTYTWDANWQKPITADSTSLTYDALGRMVEKNVSGSYTQILYSPIGKTAVMNGQTLINAYIPLPGGQTLYETPTVKNFWFTDWLGSVRLASDLSGRNVTCATCFDRAFAPYGESYSNFGSIANLNFTGDTQDTVAGELGLFDTLNRELHSHQGRWISPDPAHSGWNAYAYAANPLNSKDPSGLFPCGSCGGPPVQGGYQELTDPDYGWIYILTSLDTSLFDQGKIPPPPPFPHPPQLTLSVTYSAEDELLNDLPVVSSDRLSGLEVVGNMANVQLVSQSNVQLVSQSVEAGSSIIVPVPGSLLPNGDVAAGSIAQGIFQGREMRTLWNSANSWGNAAAIGTAGIVGLGVGAMAVDFVVGGTALTQIGVAAGPLVPLLPPVGDKITQIMTRMNVAWTQVVPYAQAFRQSAISAGTYVQAGFGTIYRYGNNYLVVGYDGTIRSFVPNAIANKGIVLEYLRNGGR